MGAYISAKMTYPCTFFDWLSQECTRQINRKPTGWWFLRSDENTRMFEVDFMRAPPHNFESLAEFALLRDALLKQKWAICVITRNNRNCGLSERNGLLTYFIELYRYPDTERPQPPAM